jgi:hypothetical protein
MTGKKLSKFLGVATNVCVPYNNLHTHYFV